MDQETSLNLPETSYSKAVWRFVEGVVLSVKDVGGPINRDLRKRIKIELQKRSASGKSNEGVADAQKMFDTKMIRVRPRFMGALASYALLSDLSNTQILDNRCPTPKLCGWCTYRTSQRTTKGTKRDCAARCKKGNA